MFDFYQRRKLKTALSSPFTRAVLVVLVVMIGYSAYTRFEIAMEMKDRREVEEAEVEKLRHKKEALEKEVRYLSDERGIEAEMRRQFDVALPNEQVVVIVEPETDETKHGSSTYQGTEDHPWYEFWH
ncbi:MAG TPA: septum formation initiator family protein [Candidatus Paceibacterota bacterium]